MPTHQVADAAPLVRAAPEKVVMVEPIETPANAPAAGRERAEAFQALVRPRLDRAYGLAYHLLGDSTEAEDACQDALLAAWREWPRLRDPERFGAWFDRIVANGCLERLRRRRRRPTVGLADIRPLEASSGTTVLDPSARVAERDAMGRALAALSPEHRAVVVLRYWADLTTDEVADRLGIAGGTVRSRLHYALADLRGSLGVDDEGDDR